MQKSYKQEGTAAYSSVQQYINLATRKRIVSVWNGESLAGLELRITFMQQIYNYRTTQQLTSTIHKCVETFSRSRSEVRYIPVFRNLTRQSPPTHSSHYIRQEVKTFDVSACALVYAAYTGSLWAEVTSNLVCSVVQTYAWLHQQTTLQ